nr:uncharacterized protein LOC105844437 [Hydra vulgaris]
MKECRNKLLVHARNEAKHRLYSSKKLIDELNIFLHNKAESLRQNCSNILTNSLKLRLKDNLSKQQRISIRKLKMNSDIKIYSFDKGTVFALLYQRDASLKLEETIKNSRIIDHDPTPTLTTKFQKQLSKLSKEGKLDTTTYFKMYPSDCVPPRIYGMVKAHKPEKDYLMRPVVSTINTPPYGTSEYLVSIIQPTLNKNKNRLINSNSFVNEARQWKIDPNEIQVSFDVVNLYPSIPIDEAIPVIIDILNNDIDDLKTQTKLSLVHIHQLIELSLSICYFLNENKIRIIPNSGPIGLSLMVVMAEAFLQNIERKALNIATICTCEPKTFVRYVDDCHARFNSIKQQQMFLNILNEQNPAIKYTVELENHQKQLNFLDVNIKNTMHGAYEFQIHRKEAIANIQLKPNSNINPNIITGVFKEFLCRAKRLCSQKYLKQEIDFLIEMFVENGHNKNNLINIARNFLKNKLKNTNYKPTDNQPFIKLPWIPIVGPKLRKELRKQNIKKNSVKGKWASSGATEHSKSCQGTFDWLHPKTISIAPEYHIRKIRESLEVNRAKIRQKLGSDEKVLNRDDGDYVTTKTWGPFFVRMFDVNI